MLIKIYKLGEFKHSLLHHWHFQIWGQRYNYIKKFSSRYHSTINSVHENMKSHENNFYYGIDFEKKVPKVTRSFAMFNLNMQTTWSLVKTLQEICQSISYIYHSVAFR